MKTIDLSQWDILTYKVHSPLTWYLEAKNKVTGYEYAIKIQHDENIKIKNYWHDFNIITRLFQEFSRTLAVMSTSDTGIKDQILNQINIK
jgi:hypothetical protein